MIGTAFKLAVGITAAGVIAAGVAYKSLDSSTSGLSGYATSKSTTLPNNQGYGRGKSGCVLSCKK